VREEQIHIPTRGSTAFARLWNTRKAGRGIVLIVHDIAEHSYRYQNFALFLAHHGYSVVAYDLKGHGHSALQSSMYSNAQSLTQEVQNNPDFAYMPFEGGWKSYLDDFSNVLQYMISGYRIKRNFIFGHGIGSLIAVSAFPALPEALRGRISGLVLSAPPLDNERQDNRILRKINTEIKQHGAQRFSPRIEKLLFNNYAIGRKWFFNRTEHDWVSSEAEEVDRYIADPLCGNVLRLGLYKTILEGKKALYAKQYHLGTELRPCPLFLFSGDGDPVSGYGRGVERLNELFRRNGWQTRTSKQYPGRHDLLHDKSRVTVYEDCLAWMEQQK